jgi:hypothetical protein
MRTLKPSVFTDVDRFVEEYDDELIRALLGRMSIRRTKDQVLQELPKAREFLVLTKLTPLQKKMYRSLLLKDPQALQATTRNMGTLRNLVMQLRKCVDHPYLFPGVEPEPFEIGEHLIDASSKLLALDGLLHVLKEQGSRVLIFSQFTSMLDILQDYLDYREWTYERLDGSLASDERLSALKTFQSNEGVFVFLISTRAGGVGLNLQQADTVVFFDSDWNPFVDLQAQDRVLRLGQRKTVKVFRLVTRDTIDEVIVRRGERKKSLFRKLMNREGFAGAEKLAREPMNLGELIQFGISTLQGDEEEIDKAILSSKVSDEVSLSRKQELIADMRVLIEGGHLREPSLELESVSDGVGAEDESLSEAETVTDIESAIAEEDPGIYWHEGRDFREDAEALRRMADARAALIRQSLISQPMSLRDREARGEESSGSDSESVLLAAAPKRRRREIEPVEELWKRTGYQSLKVSVTDAELSEEDERLAQEPVVYEVEERFGNSVDVDAATEMKSSARSSLIYMVPVDSSGRWNNQPVRTLGPRYPLIISAYESAKKNRDLKNGDVHLVPLADRIYCALCVCFKATKIGFKKSEVDATLWRRCVRSLRTVCRRTTACLLLDQATTSIGLWSQCLRLLRAETNESFPVIVFLKPRPKPEDRVRFGEMQIVADATKRSLWDGQRVFSVIRDPHKNRQVKRCLLANGAVWLKTFRGASTDIVFVDDKGDARAALESLKDELGKGRTRILKAAAAEFVEKSNLHIAALVLPESLFYRG